MTFTTAKNADAFFSFLGFFEPSKYRRNSAESSLDLGLTILAISKNADAFFSRFGFFEPSPKKRV